jgi:hypothetical protein
MLLKISCEAQSSFDVGGLCALVTSRQQNRHFAPVFLEIHPVTGAVIDPQFGDTLANGLDIPRVTCGEALNSDLNPGARTNVAQPIKPLSESLGLTNLKHVAM